MRNDTTVDKIITWGGYIKLRQSLSFVLEVFPPQNSNAQFLRVRDATTFLIAQHNDWMMANLSNIRDMFQYMFQEMFMDYDSGGIVLFKCRNHKWERLESERNNRSLGEGKIGDKEFYAVI